MVLILVAVKQRRKICLIKKWVLHMYVCIEFIVLHFICISDNYIFRSRKMQLAIDKLKTENTSEQWISQLLRWKLTTQNHFWDTSDINAIIQACPYKHALLFTRIHFAYKNLLLGTKKCRMVRCFDTWIASVWEVFPIFKWKCWLRSMTTIWYKTSIRIQYLEPVNIFLKVLEGALTAWARLKFTIWNNLSESGCEILEKGNQYQNQLYYESMFSEEVLCN